MHSYTVYTFNLFLRANMSDEEYLRQPRVQETLKELAKVKTV